MNKQIKHAYDEFNRLYSESDNKRNPIMCALVGGSTLYGLNNVDSDVDIRGVYGLFDISEIIGLSLYDKRSYESFVINTDEVDAALHEFRHFIYLLSKTNTTVLDVLYAPDDMFLVGSDNVFISRMREEPQLLVDTEKLYSSMKGYIHNEIRLLLGERTGRLGGKRKGALDEYGYSYKNLVQVLRLSFAASTFFETGNYPVRISDWDMDLHTRLMDIKTNPEKYDYAYAEEVSKTIIPKLEKAYENRSVNLKFDRCYANSLIASYYEIPASAIMRKFIP